MEWHAHTYEISGYRRNNLPVCPMKDYRSRSDMSTRTNGGTYLKNTFVSPSETAVRIKKRKKEWQLQSVLRYTQTQLIKKAQEA